MKQPTKKQISAAIKQLKQNRPELAKLINSVIRKTGRGYATLKDISQYGCINGTVSGLIYYRDTTKFYRANKAGIMELLRESSYNVDEPVIDMIGHFNHNVNICNYSHDDIARALYGRYNEDFTQIYNALAWFGTEEVIYLILNILED